jgi:hypothetical protein
MAEEQENINKESLIVERNIQLVAVCVCTIRPGKIRTKYFPTSSLLPAVYMLIDTIQRSYIEVWKKGFTVHT